MNFYRIHPGRLVLLGVFCWILSGSPAGAKDDPAQYIKEHYNKFEYKVPMRDGKRLFTAVYVPLDSSRTYPMLMLRTPYSCSPYGADQYRGSLGPSSKFPAEGYIFVYQDVRGTYMSEGEFINMTPHVSAKVSEQDVDESSDTYDTIEWLLAKVENHNGRVGMWGISYPGFYAAAGMIEAHPALLAVSPQAPIADWYFDDFHHHGAFFLPHAFNFLSSFGIPRKGPGTDRNPRFRHGTSDGYQFFLDLGPLANADKIHLEGSVPFWNRVVEHPDYDEFWQARNILPHLKKVAPAVMTVGGWYDAEDLYGPLKIYRSVEAMNPRAFNILVMGPWRHGGWSRGDGDSLGDADFGGRTSLHYRDNMEIPFFNHFLKDKGELLLAEANVFETGANRWRSFDDWPPSSAATKRLYCRAGSALSWIPPSEEDAPFDEFLSDPDHPVPDHGGISIGMKREYMTGDQRFASRRPDVLTFRTEPLTEDLTIAGPIQSHLMVSTSQSAADWVVKLIDVLPGDASNPSPNPTGVQMGNYQMMVRSEVIRGRYRESYEVPRPFTPHEPTLVPLELQDVLHTFKRGHRIMIQIQSTWFPLVDRNPQKYVENIFKATEEDFVKAMHRVYHSPDLETYFTVGVLGEKD